MTLLEKKKIVNNLLEQIKSSPDFNDDNSLNFDIDVSDDGEMGVGFSEYDLILFDYMGRDIPMSLQIFQKLLQAITDIQPIPNSGGCCANHKTGKSEQKYKIDFEYGDERIIVDVKPRIREVEIFYILDLGDGRDNIFSCSGEFFIEDFNNLLLIFSELITADLTYLDSNK